tara:strand:+ start:4594 stop:5322 length:729 start_codon:yes stop_codon:yes gene_type:complete
LTTNPNSHLVIIPTYNEIDNISNFVSEISKFNVSVLFVDDNSPDGTGELIGKISESNPQIRLLNRPSKQGLGSAYRDGFGWGIDRGYEFFIEMDADFSHSFDDLKKILQVSSDFDLIIGSRYVSGGGSQGWDFKRKLLSSSANSASRIFLRSKVKDMTSGFRCYSKKSLNEIKYQQTQSDGYAFQIEMTLRCVEKKLSIKEIPIIFNERRIGNSKMSKKIIVEALIFLINNGIKRWLNLKII